MKHPIDFVCKDLKSMHQTAQNEEEEKRVATMQQLKINFAI